MKKLLCILALWLTCAQIHAADVRVPVSDHGKLVFSLPDDWKLELDVSNPGRPPTIRISPSQGKQFVILATAVWSSVVGAVDPTPESIRTMVEKSAEKIKLSAVESELAITDFGSASAKPFGSYFTATDKAPKPGEYKFLTQGTMGIDELTIVFTILTNDDGKAVVESGLKVMKGLRREL
jgi:hypothetical protein